MNEDNKWKSLSDNPIAKWVLNIDKRQRALDTISSFAIALVVYTAVQGFTNPDFSVLDLLSFVGLFIAIASGFGVMAVQNDAINKAIIYFEENNEMFKKYNNDNIDKTYKVRNADFQRQFTKKLNTIEFEEKINDETIKKINNIKNHLFKLNNTIATTSKIKSVRKLEKKKLLLENELKELETNGINPQDVKFIMYEPSDIFAFNDGETKYGAEKVRDDSKRKHTKNNIYARFYIPIITMVVSSGLLYVLSQSLKQTIISSCTFLITLLWVWYSTYSKHIALKVKETIPTVINRNTLLTDADSEFNKKDKENDTVLEIVKKDKAYTIEEV